MRAFFLSLLIAVPAVHAQTDLMPGSIEALPPVTDTHPQAIAAGLSATGDRVAGVAASRQTLTLDWPPPGLRPFLWDASTGYHMIEVPDSLGLFVSAAEAVISPDGSTVVGVLDLTRPDPTVSASQSRAFRWTEGEGLRWLPAPEGARSRAVAASGDGSVVVGRVSPPAPTPSREVRWEADGELTTVPPLDGHERTVLRDISADGVVVVGTSFPPDGGVLDRTAFWWTADAGSHPIPGLGGYSHSEATAVSADGRVVVGYAFDGPLSNLPDAVAFRWSEDDGLTLLGTWTARDVSADGSTVVGSYRTASAVVWTAEAGTRLLQDVLDAEGWWLMSIDAVSADGTILVGGGEAPDGTEISWRARMPVE